MDLASLTSEMGRRLLLLVLFESSFNKGAVSKLTSNKRRHGIFVSEISKSIKINQKSIKHIQLTAALKRLSMASRSFSVPDCKICTSASDIILTVNASYSVADGQSR